MNDRFEPTKPQNLDEIYELTYRQVVMAEEPTPPEHTDRFVSEEAARQWAKTEDIHVTSFVKVTKLQW